MFPIVIWLIFIQAFLIFYFFFFFLILPTQLSMGTKFPLAAPHPGAKNLKELENQNKGGMWYMRHKICRKEKCLAESGLSQPAK